MAGVGAVLVLLMARRTFLFCSSRDGHCRRGRWAFSLQSPFAPCAEWELWSGAVRCDAGEDTNLPRYAVSASLVGFLRNAAILGRLTSEANAKSTTNNLEADLQLTRLLTAWFYSGRRAQPRGLDAGPSLILRRGGSWPCPSTGRPRGLRPGRQAAGSIATPPSSMVPLPQTRREAGHGRWSIPLRIDASCRSD